MPLRAIAAWRERAGKRITRHGMNSFLREAFREIPAGARVLSIGAGGEVGRLLREEAARRSFTVAELDIEARCNPDIVADICEWSSPEPFDVIVASEVLEHLRAPHAAVENIRASLRPGGLLLATVPFIYPIHGKGGDYFRFTKQGLEWLLRDFHEVEILERSTWAETMAVLGVRLMRTRHRGVAALGILGTPALLASYPLLARTGRMLRSDIMPVGYNVRARTRP